MNEPSKTLNRKDDRRSRRSQKLLFEALIDLIREKDYDSITVTEITERADLARVTFYQHFSDKDALLLSSLDTLFERVAAEMRQFSRQDLLGGVPYPALAIFEVVQRDPVLFRVILNGQGGALMLQHFQRYAAEGAYQVLKNMGQVTDVPPKLVANFVAGALLSVVTGWLEDDLQPSPEKMVQMFYRLVRPSILSVLSVK